MIPTYIFNYVTEVNGMRLIKAFTGSIESTLADQWIEIITAGKFDEHLIFAPGIILN